MQSLPKLAFLYIFFFTGKQTYLLIEYLLVFHFCELEIPKVHVHTETYNRLLIIIF